MASYLNSTLAKITLQYNGAKANDEFDVILKGTIPPKPLVSFRLVAKKFKLKNI